jgi:hypothetical protein
MTALLLLLVIPSEGRNPDGVGMIDTKKGKGARDSSADLGMT